MEYTTLGQPASASASRGSAPAASAGSACGNGKTEDEFRAADPRGRRPRHQLHRHRAGLRHRRRGGARAQDHPARPGRGGDQGPRLPRRANGCRPSRVVASLDNSLRLMGTDYVDVFNLHGVEPTSTTTRSTCWRPRSSSKAQGQDPAHRPHRKPDRRFHQRDAQARGARRRVGGVHGGLPHAAPGRAQNVFPATREKGIGTLLMFAVRSIFADPPRVARELKALAARGAGGEDAGRDRMTRSGSWCTRAGRRA